MADGVTKDYIKLKYKDDDVLYIPTNALDNIRKYVGPEKIGPRLNRLGSKEWDKTKDQANNRKLLDKMKNVPMEKRRCAFHCAMAAVFPDGKEIIAHETWEGRLLFEERGKNGFGYDPLFFDEELKCTGAEMEKSVKMGRSHRAKALQAVIEAFGNLK